MILRACYIFRTHSLRKRTATTTNERWDAMCAWIYLMVDILHAINILKTLSVLPFFACSQFDVHVCVCACRLNIRTYVILFFSSRFAIQFISFFCMYLMIFHHLFYRFCFNFYRVISSFSLSLSLALSLFLTIRLYRSFRNSILPLHGSGHTLDEKVFFLLVIFRKLYTFWARDIVNIERKIRTHTWAQQAHACTHE